MMKPAISVLAFVVAFTGCDTKPKKQRDLESGISALVERAAPLEEIVAQLGAPYHIYTRDEVQGVLVKTPERDVAVRETWTLLSQYPETLYYRRAPNFENYVFLDANRKAVGSHFTTQ